MGLGGISIWQLLIVLVIVVLLFSGRRVTSFLLVSGSSTNRIHRNQATSAIPRNESNSVSRAETTRDAIYDHLLAALEKTGVKGEVFKSPPYSDVIWVVVQIQDPVEGFENLSLRGSAEITIEPVEFRRFSHNLTIVLRGGRKQRRYAVVVAFDQDNAVAVCRYLAGQTRNLSPKFDKHRVFPWQLWRPKNKLAGVKVAHNYPAYVTFGGLFSLNLPVLGIPLLLIGGTWWIVSWYNRKSKLSLTPGKPLQEPRILLRMDSWQTVLYDLAPYADELKNQIKQRFAAGAQVDPTQNDERSANIVVASEHIWQQGVDGKVEREQLVVRLRRALSFVHIYTYGNDLYVGWDAHLNGGTWIEKSLGVFRHTRSGKVAQVYEIQSAWHTPTEYDITDANFLLETIHSAVTKVIKQALAEHKIDQEIDFSIVREARQDLVGSSRPVSQQAKKKSRFQRVG